MNLLIVDDDRFVVASLERGLNWSALGFNKIYTAYNITSAQTILKENTIHLLISDIDMPQGSGLDLLSWMRERHDETITIFLTNYADFNYAQKAVELKTFRYFLKPIQFDKLEQIVRDAVSHLQNVQVLSQKRCENFWQTIIHQDCAPSQEFLQKQLLQAKLPEKTASTYFLPIIIDVFPYYLTSDNELKSHFTNNEELLNYLTTTFHAVFSDFTDSETIFLEYDQHTLHYLAILPVREALLPPQLHMDCENYVQLIAKQTHCDTSCFVGVPTLLQDFYNNFSALNTMCANKLAHKKQVMLLSEYRQPSTDFPPLDTKLLEIYLENQQYPAFLSLCSQYLHKLAASHKLHSLSITNFQVDFVQVIHLFLKSKEISSSKLFYNDSYHFLSRIARTSCQAMELYVQYMVNTLKHYMESTFSDTTQVAAIKNYIDQHFTEDISLSMFSEMFFMDSDYASKLFKKEYGISIKNYIINKRIDAAKELLAATDLPVNMVAITVGYENYSYFTRLFKKMTNLTPIDFRNQVQPVEFENK